MTITKAIDRFQVISKHILCILLMWKQIELKPIYGSLYKQMVVNKEFHFIISPILENGYLPKFMNRPITLNTALQLLMMIILVLLGFVQLLQWLTNSKPGYSMTALPSYNLESAQIRSLAFLNKYSHVTSWAA